MKKYKDGAIVTEFTDGVPVEVAAREQIQRVSQMPFVPYVAVMPDVHLGMGATIGSVIACDRAIIPSAVGVDIGCGMHAIRTGLTANDLPDDLKDIRTSIEESVPVGNKSHGIIGVDAAMVWTGTLLNGYENISDRHAAVRTKKHPSLQLGTLGGGNHFIEMCLDKEDRVWIMLHSGSRGIGNRIGQHFISTAKREMERWHINLPDQNLAYLPEGSEYFQDYIDAVEWAQNFAYLNRMVMMEAVFEVLYKYFGYERVNTGTTDDSTSVIDCHHNYVERENHHGKNLLVTRKGAVRARKGDMGIIPGSMGERSFIVRGLGNKDSLMSCSHGAGRVMSRTAAKNKFNKKDLAMQTAGVECRKDSDVVDEIPSAYKNIDDVMAAQAVLVEIVHELKQVLCVKG